MLRILTSSLLVGITSGSFCGPSSVPYSLEILPDSQPVLGCARPTCFGWAPDGKPANVSGSFYRINDHVDGFIRAGPESIPAYGPEDSRYQRPQAAVCEQTYSSQNCTALDQWVGGIGPLQNVSQYGIMLQCCSFDSLAQSEDRGIASLHGGQIVIGGEVISAGIQVAFDYISDIVKIIRDDGSVQYDVSIRRMPCTDPTAIASKLDKPEFGAQAFQAPILAANEPLPLPNAGNTPVGPPPTAVLEEIVQEEAVQLPPGTQFQPSLVPPPPQPIAFQSPQFVPQAPPQPYYSAPSSNYGGSGLYCFTNDMTVQTLDGQIKRMDQLQKEDWVLTVENMAIKYEPIDFWLHRVPNQEAEFNVLETEDGKTIKLTDKHYIYKGTCERVGLDYVPINLLQKAAVTADQVHAGDCLYTLRDDMKMQEVRVVRAGKVTQIGIYAPMTQSGRILVNGIHASCHNIIRSHSVGYVVFESFDYVSRLYDRIFGSNSSSDDIVETPRGLSTILDMARVFLPNNLVTL